MELCLDAIKAFVSAQGRTAGITATNVKAVMSVVQSRFPTDTSVPLRLVHTLLGGNQVVQVIC